MRKAKFPILDAVHDTAKGRHKAGVMDQVTLREFDQLCLPPTARPQTRQNKSSSSAKQRKSRGQ